MVSEKLAQSEERPNCQEPDNQTDVSNNQSQVPNDISSAGDEELSGEILQMMGQRIAPERIPAQAIHKDLVVRIEEIIKNGLPVEERKKLVQKFPPPSNCLVIDPPKLNLEVKASLQEAVVKRDSRIREKQERIAAGIAGLVSLMTTVFKLESEEKLPMIDKLSGIIRILSDLQHEELSIRRGLIMKNINVSLRETLTLASADEWLFGSKLDEKIKTAKTLETYTRNLKPAKPHHSAPESSKNWKGPSRRQYPPRNKFRQNYRTSGGRKSFTSQEQRRRGSPKRSTYHRRKKE